MNFKKWSF